MHLTVGALVTSAPPAGDARRSADVGSLFEGLPLGHSRGQDEKRGHMSRSLACVTILMVVASFRFAVALGAPSALIQAAGHTEKPITIAILNQRWITISNVAPTLGVKVGRPGSEGGAFAGPLQIECQVGGYTGKEVVVVLEFHATDEATPDVRRFRYAMSPIKVQRPTMTVAGDFIVWGVALEGRGTIDIYLTDKKEHIISNRLSIPAAAGPAAEKALEAELGPATKEAPQ